MRFHKKIRRMLFGAALCIGMTAFSPGVFATGPEITLRMGTVAPEIWSLGEVIKKVFEPKLEEYSGGRIDLVVHYRGSLCSEAACIEQLGLGQIDIATSSSSNVGAFGTTFNIIDLPYLFQSQEEASRIINSWLSEELGRSVEREMGMHLIALVPVGGFRNVVNSKREVRVPSDLKGLKIRVTKSPTEFNLIKSWGAIPVPYAWASLYEGLQSGVVQGMYVQDIITSAFKFYEVVSNITQVNGAYVAHPVMMSKKRYDGLPDWARKAIDRAGRDMQREAFAIDLAWQKVLLGAMKGKIAVYVPGKTEREQWQRGAREAWISVKGTYDPKIARRILAEQGQTGLINQLESAGAL